MSKMRLIKSEFVRDDGIPFPQPEMMEASREGISVLIRHEKEEDDGPVADDVVFLSPRHIEAIVAMAEDWGESHWDALHEEQA